MKSPIQISVVADDGRASAADRLQVQNGVIQMIDIFMAVPAHARRPVLLSLIGSVCAENETLWPQLRDELDRLMPAYHANAGWVRAGS